MSLYYSPDSDEIKDEIEDARLVLRPIEVSELLDLHPNTIYRLMKKGSLPAQKLGGTWRIYKHDLIRFIEQYSQ